MTKKEVEELQNSLLELVPNNIRNSKELTRSSKILLGNFIFLNGMDKAKENGFVFRSNKLLEDDTKLSNKTIIKNISKLIQLGFITRSTGNRVDGASTYILNYEILNSYQGCNFKGVKSEENYTYKLHLSLEEKINSMSLEIKELKNMVKELIGVISDMGVKIKYTTDTDIDPEIDKKYNIHVNIPEVINKNKFINNNINVDNTDEVFLSNFMKVDNINVDNSNEGIKNLKIEENINLNNENEMNEERMNEMNNIINSNETDINTSTKSLEDILTEQSDEFNTIIQFMNNSVEDTDEVNTYDKFMNNSVIDTDVVDTSNKFMNISVEEQKRYQRLFDKCKSQIEIWMKTHEYSCVSMFDSYFKAIQDMNDEHLISVKQWNAAQRYLFQRFNNLRKGYNNYIQNKKKTISSNEVNECNNPQPPRRQIDQMDEAV